jgi:hypothetical protein
MYRFILNSAYVISICFFGRIPCRWLIAGWLERRMLRLRRERQALLLNRREHRNMARLKRQMKEKRCSE